MTTRNIDSNGVQLTEKQAAALARLTAMCKRMVDRASKSWSKPRG